MILTVLMRYYIKFVIEKKYENYMGMPRMPVWKI